MSEKIDQFDREYNFLSNFYPASLVVDGIEYLSSEGAYQAAKCADINDRLLYTEQPPNIAKNMSRKTATRPDWRQVKIDEMRKIIRAKFTQNPHLARYLVDTGDAELMEGNVWHDVYWGIDLKTGEGKNHLGKLLMELRADFRQNGLPPMSGQLPWRYETAPDGLSVHLMDLTQLSCQAIVHATNEALYGHDGLDYAVHRAAGPELRRACEMLGGCAVTQAKLTPGFDLKAQYVIHTVGPHYSGGDDDTLLAQTYENILNLASASGIRTIAIPAISVGKSSYPKDRGTAVAVESVRRWMRADPASQLEISFACLDLAVYRGFCKALGVEDVETGGTDR